MTARRRTRAAKAAVALAGAAVLIAACTGESGSNSSQNPIADIASTGTARNPNSTNGVTCRTAKTLQHQRECGTAKIALEWMTPVTPPRIYYVGLGQNAEEVSRHVAAANQHLDDVMATSPARFSQALRLAAADVRQRILRVCALEGAHAGYGYFLPSELLRIYVWLEYRLFLIDDRHKFVGSIDNMLANVCLGRDKATYFGSRPEAFQDPGNTVYFLTGFFARALSSYHAEKGRRVVAEAFAFRALLDEVEPQVTACLERKFDAGKSTLGSVKDELWDRCLELAFAGHSCVERANSCVI